MGGGARGRDGGEGHFCKKTPRKTHETLPANPPVSGGGEGGGVCRHKLFEVVNNLAYNQRHHCAELISFCSYAHSATSSLASGYHDDHCYLSGLHNPPVTVRP